MDMEEKLLSHAQTIVLDFLKKYPVVGYKFLLRLSIGMDFLCPLTFL